MNAGKHILLVEDNEADSQLTLRALRRQNIDNEVVLAGDGTFALDYALRRGEFAQRDVNSVLALVLLDLNLPGFDGLEVLRELRERDEVRNVPVVAISSNPDPKRIAAAYELGCNSFVLKSDDSEEFSQRILNVAMYWLLLNRTV